VKDEPKMSIHCCTEKLKHKNDKQKIPFHNQQRKKNIIHVICTSYMPFALSFQKFNLILTNDKNIKISDDQGS